MYVIRRQRDNTALWLASTHPERWDGISQAVRFDTRGRDDRDFGRLVYLT
jgi:hypothetical protein